MFGITIFKFPFVKNKRANTILLARILSLLQFYYKSIEQERKERTIEKINCIFAGKCL